MGKDQHRLINLMLSLASKFVTSDNSSNIFSLHLFEVAEACCMCIFIYYITKLGPQLATRCEARLLLKSCKFSSHRNSRRLYLNLIIWVIIMATFLIEMFP